MDFDPKLTLLRSTRDFFEYLERNGPGAARNHGGMVSPEDKCQVPSPHGGVFIRQILAQEMKIPLTAFIHNILSYIRVAPLRLTVGCVADSLGLRGPLQSLPPGGVQAQGVLRRLHDEEGPSGRPLLHPSKGL